MVGRQDVNSMRSCTDKQATVSSVSNAVAIGIDRVVLGTAVYFVFAGLEQSVRNAAMASIPTVDEINLEDNLAFLAIVTGLDQAMTNAQTLVNVNVRKGW